MRWKDHRWHRSRAGARTATGSGTGAEAGDGVGVGDRAELRPHLGHREHSGLQQRGVDVQPEDAAATIWHSMAWHGMVWHGMAHCSRLQQSGSQAKKWGHRR